MLKINYVMVSVNVMINQMKRLKDAVIKAFPHTNLMFVAVILKLSIHVLIVNVFLKENIVME